MEPELAAPACEWKCRMDEAVAAAVDAMTEIAAMVVVGVITGDEASLEAAPGLVHRQEGATQVALRADRALALVRFRETARELLRLDPCPASAAEEGRARRRQTAARLHHFHNQLSTL